MGIAIALIVGALVVGGAAYYFLVLNQGDVFERSLALAERGEYTDARGLLRSRVDRDPNDARAQYYMARIYQLEGNDDLEVHHLQEVRRIGRYTSEVSPARVLNRLGQIFYKQERYRESYEAFNEQYTLNSSDEEALTYLGYMAIGQEEFELADGYFRRLTALAPSVPDHHLARGVALAMIKHRDALQCLETGLALAPHDITPKFLCALQAFRVGDAKKAVEHLTALLTNIEDPNVAHMANRLAVGIYYLSKDFEQALAYAERCLTHAVNQNWSKEEYDARLSSAYMAMLIGDLEKAGDNLIELEMRHPSDDQVLKVSDFRMDLEEGVTTVDRVSPRGFDLLSHLQDWQRRRFPEDAIYKLSGLAMDASFDIMDLHTKQAGPKPKAGRVEGPDPNEMIARFNELKGQAFEDACARVISAQGFQIEKPLPNRDKDGLDFIVRSLEDRKVRALVRIRQWANQPISDIFLRNMQNTMNELKVNLGFVVAGARLTSGAEAALKNLKKITVINEYDLGELLGKVMN